MTKEQLKKANELNERIEWIDKIIDFLPDTSYGGNWVILIRDQQALTNLVAAYGDRFVPIFCDIRSELQSELEEL